MQSVVLLFGFIFVLYVQSVSSFRIGAFNVQIFGKSKMSKPEVVNVLVEIISRYDIILIQEIRDASEEAIYKLLELVNENDPGGNFAMQLSPRLGRTNSKEQYAFLYRESNGIHIQGVYVYDDGNETLSTVNNTVDTFEREPYVIWFSSDRTALKEFVLIGVHVAPGNAVAEINHLQDVFTDAKQRWNIDDIVVMGDLNADCSYVPQKYWANIPLKHDPSYLWLIPDDDDTTVSDSDCAYDRFIMTGEQFIENHVNGSATVFRYDIEYGLNESLSSAVSDHYPIDFLLKEKKISSDGASLMGTHVNYLFTALILIYFKFY
ncbi:deoxyribonuclease-1-like [Mya arenaria]|uniref:deoxyribonuclease-1-like n=1 Tax=Mya arenaria TaxID=6604 RepID=UPI0022E957AC|nr:deoxyribonuclease-1-like [Mya arenaria]